MFAKSLAVVPSARFIKVSIPSHCDPVCLHIASIVEKKKTGEMYAAKVVSTTIEEERVMLDGKNRTLTVKS